ncbi:MULTISPECIES: adhesive domain-containing protein [Carnobacterium]|uniref:adhesive domain-containing protein n=1 Tax=Carnobacterium TaxID=2747 RepID=UPI00288CD1A6|nr:MULTISPECIES: adhesive domain-containing protein [Carnobacterium]MDT1939728.1 LPXTG cell wall anchor domain-containing protein [Carnobacterium divergens]MDT1942166.1 LPXTG cell wall anchor domain-containing protein [Carnobacterium divergens]MDT1947964.1 LPXTG cell wall anchor domain-containing protein [Carnobacterium divergens]MDT1950452.1 LPXTG cell wall anchor domain-containing protein [Carnobacterium divergens]MDT1955630.1 LPXTG cell wall anchor domain-containing protein [Carnobacterium 
MSSQKNQSKKSKTNKKVFQKAVIVSAASVLLASPIIPLFQDGHFIGFQEQTAQAALADVSILNNTQLVSNNGTNLSPNGAGNYDLDLTYSGDALASVGLGTPKVVVFALPTELQGKVVGGATVAIDAKLLPITPAQLPGLPLLIGTAETALTTLDNAANLAGQGTALDPVIAAFQAIKTAQNFGNYQETLPGVVSPDGKYISVNFTDGLGNYVKQLLKGLFDALHNAINAVAFTGIAGVTLNPLLATLKNALNPIFTVVDGLLNLTGEGLNNLISASLLAGTSYNVKFAVSPPGTAQSKITAGAINTSLISAGILGDIQSEGASVTLNFANPAWTAYTITPPTINPVHVGDTSLTGTVALTSPIPAGSTFSTVVTLPDGSTATAVVNPDGSFTAPFGSYIPKSNDSLSTVIEGINGGVTKTSTPVTTTVLANTSPGWDTYVVAPPVIDAVHAGDTEITGKTTLTTPIPTGSTFTTIITLANGTEVTATINPDGTFTAALGNNTVAEGDILSSIVEAVNGTATKNSTPVLTTVLAALPDPAWAGYVIASPVVETVSVGDTSIKGKVTLTTPIPNGSTFTAIVTLKDGTKVTATVNPDGTFTVPLGSNTLTAGDILSTIIQGVNGGAIKNSTPVETTVLAEGWKDYVVSTPIVNPIYVGDTTVTGTVALATPIPAGTTFEAIVTLPAGTKVTATVNPDGTFTAPLGSYIPKEGDTISTIIEATNNGETKDSTPVVTTIKPVSESPAWLNYVVAAPMINPIHVGDTTLIGKVTLNTPIPLGTTFSTIVTLPDNTKLNAVVAPDGSITVALNGYIPKLGDSLSTVVQVANGTATKDSTPVVSVVQATLPDPAWAGYTVSPPVIDSVHVGDTEITGSVNLTKPIPNGSSFTTLVTLPNGNVVQAPVNPDGTFTVALGSNLVAEGDVVSTIVQGINGGVTKDSPVVETTVLAALPDPAWGAYVIASPVVEPVSVGDTAITGKVTLTTPIPNGSTFTAIVTLKDGTKVTATVNPDGTFTVPLGSNTLTAEDILSTIIQGVNGGAIKTSTPVETTVLAEGWKDYVVSTPIVNPIYVGDTTVTGTVALATPIPAGTTFEAIVTLPDGTKVTSTVNPDGTFTAPLGSYIPKEGDTISTIVEATNNGETKDSIPVVTTIKPASESPAWLNYVVAAPVLNPVHAGDTTLTGNVTLNTPIPAGTTFKVVVTLPDGNKVNAVVGIDGNISVSLGSYTAVAGDTLSSVVEATNGTATKLSTPVTSIVQTALPDPAWATYTVAPPVVSPVHEGDTTITGKVTLTTPIPNGSSFTALVTLPNGTVIQAQVNPDGTFTVALGDNILKEGDSLSTIVQGINGGVTKDSTPVISIVEPSASETEWNNYVIAAPTINQVHEEDATLTGSELFSAPVPAGATFVAIVTLADGSTIEVPVSTTDGVISIPFGAKKVKKNDILSIVIRGTKAGVTKESLPTSTTVLASAWEDYVVSSPVIDPIHAGDKTITGSVTLNQPVPADTSFTAIVTLPDGTVITAPVDSNGHISVDLGDNELTSGDVTIVVEATHGGETKESTPVTSTILPNEAWDAYVITKPVINAIHVGDKFVTGKVTLNTPIPAGTVFTAIITLPDGSIIEGSVAEDGTFKAALTPITRAILSNYVLKVGDQVTALIKGVNGGEVKEGPSASTIVLAVDTNNPGTPVTPGKPGSGNGTGTTPGNTGTANGGKYTTTKANGKGSKDYQNNDNYPQTGEQNNSLFSYLGFLTLGSAALLFLRKKFAKK